MRRPIDDQLKEKKKDITQKYMRDTVGEKGNMNLCFDPQLVKLQMCCPVGKY